MYEEVTIGDCRLILGDCREVLPLLPKVDLILADPPYGIGADAHAGKAENGWRQYGSGGWDKERPAPWLFGLMIEKGDDCIIWGGNYFTDLLPPTMQWLVWDKGQRNFSLADCEFAWSSKQQAARVLTLSRGEALQDGKEHPTQKPTAANGMVYELCAKSKNGLRSIHGQWNDRRSMRKPRQAIHRH